jgi:hypothetical protein
MVKLPVSPIDWAALAKSIKCQEIPREARRKIYDALLVYRLDEYNEKGSAEDEPHPRGKIDRNARERKALEEFINYARVLRVQINNIQRFLKDPGWQGKVEQLIADIHELQEFAERELESRPASKGGRPPQLARDFLVARSAVVYQQITGKKAGASVDPETGHVKGPFVRFVSTIFRQQHISLTGIRHVIDKAVAETPL